MNNWVRDDWFQLATAAGFLLTGVGTVWGAFKISRVERHTNGMHSELIAAAEERGLAEGKRRAGKTTTKEPRK